MDETATCNIRIRAIDHKRLKQLSRWANHIPLSRVAHDAIEGYWRMVKDARKARLNKAWEEGR